MFSIRKPGPAEVESLVSVQRRAAPTFDSPGNGLAAPPGFRINRHRVRLGYGTRTYDRACRSLREWTMLDLGWVDVGDATAPIEVGRTVAVLVRVGGLWVSNACRISRVIEESGASRSFGFAYKTLPRHVRRGEESFSIEHHDADDAVWYELAAVSRPRYAALVLGEPFARRVQRRFARDTMLRMQQAVLEHA